MLRFLACICAIALIVAMPADVATAGPLTTDSAALALWQGTAVFDGQNASGSATVHAYVEYAVYGPGTFATSVALNNPGAADWSDGAYYIYAYQVYNDGGDATDKRVATWSVDLLPNAAPTESNYVGNYDYGGIGDLAPASGVFVGAAKTNVKWTYSASSNHLVFGDHSDILYFASPYYPICRPGTIGGTSAAADTQLVPSPAPEPGTLALATLAALGLIAARFFRRRAR